MAYYINPDGTISVVDAKYDSYGNVVLRDFSKLEDSNITRRDLYGIDHSLASKNKSKKKKKAKANLNTKEDIEKNVNDNREEIAKDVAITKRKVICSGTLYDSTPKTDALKKVIDKFILKRKQQNRIITNTEYRTILHRLNIECKLYFIEAFAEYKSYCDKMGLYQEETNPQKNSDFVSIPNEYLIRQIPKNEKKKKKQKKIKQTKNSFNKQDKEYLLKEIDDLQKRVSGMSSYLKNKSSDSSSSGHSLGDIATFSSLKKTTPDSDYIQGRAVNGASRQPKYCYARDRYGRVQERDRLNEDRFNEFSQAQNHNKNYDYSDYDSNDDHDGAYSGWE